MSTMERSEVTQKLTDVVRGVSGWSGGIWCCLLVFWHSGFLLLLV